MVWNFTSGGGRGGQGGVTGYRGGTDSTVSIAQYLDTIIFHSKLSLTNTVISMSILETNLAPLLHANSIFQASLYQFCIR